MFRAAGPSTNHDCVPAPPGPDQLRPFTNNRNRELASHQHHAGWLHRNLKALVTLEEAFTKGDQTTWQVCSQRRASASWEWFASSDLVRTVKLQHAQTMTAELVEAVEMIRADHAVGAPSS
jgi:hypothetical protein